MNFNKSIFIGLLITSLSLLPILTFARQAEQDATNNIPSFNPNHTVFLPITIYKTILVNPNPPSPAPPPSTTPIPFQTSETTSTQTTTATTVNPSYTPTFTMTPEVTFTPSVTPTYATPTTTPTPTASTTPTPIPTLTPDPTPTPSPTIEPPDGLIWIDRHSVELFEHIPLEYLEAARNMHMLFSDRSVGQNINEGLDCLTATSWAASPASCRRDYYDENWNWRTFTQADLDEGLVPDRILFDPDPILYNRDDWTFVFDMGGWSELTQSFIQVIAPQYLDTKDALSYQFSYLNVTEDDDIADPEVGYFSANPSRFTVFDYEAFITQHPEKIFYFWTTSLARGIGSQVSTDFNIMMRDYALEHEKILFDVADILSHTDLGEPCYDNRDGVPYCDMHGNCEDYPDDGLDLPAICQDYTTEVDGGHLGSVSGGKIRVAKAFWVLMAQIAGWDGQPVP